MTQTPCRVLVNGTDNEVPCRPDATLLEVVRDGLGLTGTKGACARGECGACTVLVSGEAVLACLLLAACVDGPVTTIEGLREGSRPVREALADLGGFQCGYCTSGMVVMATAILRAGRRGDDGELRRALSGNLCRCTGYQAVVEAIAETAAGPEPAG